MNEVEFLKENNKIIVKLSGRVESVFAEKHTQEILDGVLNSESVSLDFEQVSYISSAGLRLVLKIAKVVKNFECINLNESVYEIFSISGFTEMMKIKKALRTLSIEGKELIGEGANGRVYRCDIDTIVKVYKDWSNMSYIENEIAMSKKAFMLGVPTAIPFDIVKIKEGGFGTVYEMLKSDVLSSLIKKYPEKSGNFIKFFADALSKFLHTETDDESLPKKIEYPLEWVEFLESKNLLSPEVIGKTKRLLKTVENGHTLIHGDFHFKNVMVQNDEPIIIDMDTLGVGHPIFEITYSLYSMVEFDKVRPTSTIKFFGLDYETVVKLFYEAFDLVFINKTKEEKEDILNKARFLANLRIAYRTHHHVPNDLEKGEVAIKYLNENIDKLETLDFKL